jgi:hypothetical protein
VDAEQPPNLTAPKALKVIREIGAETENIVVVPHGKKRARQRSVTRRQIELCVQRGTIQEGPVLNDKGHWQVTLYRHAAGEELWCVVAIDWPVKVVIITTHK